LWSEQFDNAAYTKLISVSANTTATLDPSGYYGADKLIETTSYTQQWIYQALSMSGAQTFSVYAKAAERNFIALATAGSDPSYFNISTGVVVSTASGVTTSIQSVGNGWFRCSITTASTTSPYAIIWISDNGSRVGYAGDNTNGNLCLGRTKRSGSLRHLLHPHPIHKRDSPC